MKRLILALGIGAAALAVSTPASAQTGCRWYDVNCRIATGDTRAGTSVGTGVDRVDSSWRVIGHDANGNAIYERRRVDGNGNVIVERARRDASGRMVIIDRDVSDRNVNNSSSWRIIGHDANGNAIYERRRVDGNGNVIVERARRDALGRMVIIDRDVRNRNDRNVRDSRRFDRDGMDCTYKENPRGSMEKCKYDKNKSNRVNRTNRINRTNRVNSERYRAANLDNVYRTSAVYGDKYKAGKANSAKHNKSNGKAKGHNKH
jgi:hypothetical protein